MSYRAEYEIKGTDSTLTVTDTEASSSCAAHGHLSTVQIAEYAFPGEHVERVARMHHLDVH